MKWCSMSLAGVALVTSWCHGSNGLKLTKMLLSYPKQLYFASAGFNRTDLSIFPGRNTPLHVTEAPPDILEALEGDALWDYDIVKLERVTNNR